MTFDQYFDIILTLEPRIEFLPIILYALSDLGLAFEKKIRLTW